MTTTHTIHLAGFAPAIAGSAVAMGLLSRYLRECNLPTRAQRVAEWAAFWTTVAKAEGRA